MALVNRGRPTLALWAGLLVGLVTPGCQYSMSIAWPPVSEQFAQRQAMARGDPDPTGYLYPSRFADVQQAAHQPEQGPAPRMAQPQQGAQPMPADKGQGQAPATVGMPVGPDAPPVGRVPTELEMTFMPCYIIEPPDELLIEAVRVVPRGPYRIEPLDVLQIVVADPLPGQPIAGQYQVSSDGLINLGYSYGSVRVAGMTLEEAANAIKKHLQARALANPQVSVALAAFRAL
jgi:hypothetical protein